MFNEADTCREFVVPKLRAFFDRTGSTKSVWYYEILLPEGRKNYTKENDRKIIEIMERVKGLLEKGKA